MKRHQLYSSFEITIIFTGDLVKKFKMGQKHISMEIWNQIFDLSKTGQVVKV